VRYLLDTCVLSEMLKSTPDARVVRWLEARKPHELCISAMTWGELQRGVARLPHSRRKSALTRWLGELESGFEERILSFDQKTAHVWADLTVHAETQGKTVAAFDSIIAATARAFACTLVTRNTRDFEHVGTDLLNPWHSA
jgi:predicted nucleic acid-binding protein